MTTTVAGEACERIADGDIHLVVIDDTSNVDGSLRLIQSLRMSGSFQPIVLVSATSGEDATADALALGPSVLVGKPADMREFYQAVSQLLLLKAST